MDKKTISVIIILLLLLVIIIGFMVYGINRNNNMQENEYTGTIDLEYIKQTISENEYYTFEDGGQKYILFKIVESVFVPDEIVIESAEITNKEYTEENVLILNIDVKTDITRGYLGEGLKADGKTKDNRFFTLKINNDFTGLIVNDEEYTKFQGGIIHESSSDKYGYINADGNISIPLEYDNISELDDLYYDEETDAQLEIDYSNYLRLYKENEGIGIASKDGNILIDCQYDTLLNYGENTFAATKGDLENAQLSIIDINGNIIKDYIDGGIFGSTKIFNKYADISLNGKHGVVNRNLETIIPAEYDRILIETIDSDNADVKNQGYYFIVEDDGEYAVMDESGNLVIDFSYSSVYDLINEYENGGYDVQSIFETIGTIKNQ